MPWERKEQDAGRRKRAEGAVSVYFIAATAAFVLLNGLLIDFARVAAFRKQAELAAKSGARSVLSSFDPGVYARYGLFIRGGEPANDVFRRTLEGNLEQDGPRTFRFLDARWDGSEVTESRPLASHDVFRRQVLEDMKYKAPIDLTIELLSRFRGVDEAMKETKRTVDVLEKMRKAYDRRQAALEEVLKRQKEAGEKLEKAMAGYVPDPAVSMSGTRPARDVADIADAALMYPDYWTKRMEDEERSRAHGEAVAQWNSRREAAAAEGKPFREPYPAGGAMHTAATNAYASGMAEIASDLPDKLRKAEREAWEALEAAKEALRAAEEANEEMREIAANASDSAEEASGSVGAGAGAGGIGKEASETLRELRQSADELVMDNGFFADYAGELNGQQADASEIAAAAEAFGETAASAPDASGLGVTLRSRAERLQSSGAHYRSRYGSSGSVLKARRDRLDQLNSADKERKRMESEAAVEWESARSLLGGLAAIGGTSADREAFAELTELYESNLAWNEAEDSRTEPVPSRDPSQGRDEAVGAAEGWLSALTEAALNARDTLYFAEYAISRFSISDHAEVMALLAGTGEGATSPERQEAEFILYGLNHPGGNIAAAYGEIFSLRLAIRTMEGLIESRTLGHPLLVLAGALLYAVANAVADIRQLLDSGTVLLSKFLKAETAYSDYLRLFYLLQGGSAGQIARMIAVIERNTGLTLQKAYTYVSGTGRATLRLWFFPGVAGALGKIGQMGGEVAGNRYEAEFTADDAYQ